MNKILKHISLLVIVFFLTACGGEEDLDSGPIIKKPSRKKVVKPTVSKNKEDERIALLQNMRAGRNPFQSYILDEDTEDKGPLECCDITQFKVLLTLIGLEGGDKAKVIAPGGKRFTVQIGTKIGNRKGKVYKISDGTIFIKEKHKNVLGEEETVRVEIALPQAK